MTENATTKSISYRQDIDGIRALAVIAVIINHINKDVLPSGYLGVDIFFVISGYVITSSLSNKSHKGFGDFLMEFYSRRIKRLVPALILNVIISSILICFFNPNPKSTLETGITSLFGLSNIYLYIQNTNYFSSSAEKNIFTHTWSLGIEEQFYFLFPFIFWFSGFGRQTKFGLRNFFFVMLLSFAVSFANFIYLSDTNQPAAYFLMTSRFWELSIGCLVFLTTKIKFFSYDQIIQNFFSPNLIALLLIATLFFPSYSTIISTFFVVLLTATLISSLRKGTIAFSFFSLPLVVSIGVISYSLYLWHWTVVVISRWTIGIYWWSIPIQISLIILMAIASFVFIETPLRKAEWSAIRWKIVGYGLLSCLMCSILMTAYIKQSNLSFYLGNKPNISKTGPETLRDLYYFNGIKVWSGDKCVLASNNEVGKKINPKDCTIGNFYEAKKRFLVIGNSFSAALLEMYAAIPENDIGAVMVTSSWDASPIPDIPNNGKWGKANDYYWKVLYPDLISQLLPGDVVLMVNDIANLSPQIASTSSNEQLKLIQKGVDNLAKNLLKREISLGFMHGNPFLRESNCHPSQSINQWFSTSGISCTYYNREESLKRRMGLNGVLNEVREKNSNFFVFDLFDVFCPTNICDFQNNKVFLYRDEYSHPSVEGAKLAQKSFLRQILGYLNKY